MNHLQRPGADSTSALPVLLTGSHYLGDTHQNLHYLGFGLTDHNMTWNKSRNFPPLQQDKDASHFPGNHEVRGSNNRTELNWQTTGYSHVSYHQSSPLLLPPCCFLAKDSFTVKGLTHIKFLLMLTADVGDLPDPLCCSHQKVTLVTSSQSIPPCGQGINRR